MTITSKSKRPVVAIGAPSYDPAMMKRLCAFFLWSLFAGAIACNTSVMADEGMWLFNAPPLKQLKEKYQFEPTQQWLEHLQKASVRFNSGGSGSFVSANGLVITNHHVGADTLQKMSDAQHNYLKDGFYARTQADENQIDRSRAQRADVNRRCYRARERSGETGNDERPGFQCAQLSHRCD
jgi:hypothetical protein